MLLKILPYKKYGNILDIGTASGFLLEEAKKLGFEIIYMKPALKTMTIQYMRNQFNVYKLFPITQIFNLINYIPIINNFRFNIKLGESLVILKKV